MTTNQDKYKQGKFSLKTNLPCTVSNSGLSDLYKSHPTN